MSWTSPKVIGEIGGGVLLLALSRVIESRVAEPMFHLRLFRIRAFTAGNIASLLMFLARGGLQFILIIWLQGIWLPEHGYSFAEHAAVGRASTCCRWSAACCSPARSPASSRTASAPARSRPLGAAARGRRRSSCSRGCRSTSPTRPSRLLLALNGIGMGLFISPNRAAVMNSLPPWRRGVGSGMTDDVPELAPRCSRSGSSSR